MRDDLHHLRSENRRLRELLAKHGIEIPPDKDRIVQPAVATNAPARTPEE